MRHSGGLAILNNATICGYPRIKPTRPHSASAIELDAACRAVMADAASSAHHHRLLHVIRRAAGVSDCSTPMHLAAATAGSDFCLRAARAVGATCSPATHASITQGAGSFGTGASAAKRALDVLATVSALRRLIARHEANVAGPFRIAATMQLFFAAQACPPS
jgi:hypothetical protein